MTHIFSSRPPSKQATGCAATIIAMVCIAAIVALNAWVLTLAITTIITDGVSFWPMFGLASVGAFIVVGIRQGKT